MRTRHISCKQPFLAGAANTQFAHTHTHTHTYTHTCTSHHAYVNTHTHVRVQIPFDMRDIAGHMLTILTSLESEAFAISKAHREGKATDEELELSNVLLEVVQVRVACACMGVWACVCAFVFARACVRVCVYLCCTSVADAG